MTIFLIIEKIYNYLGLSNVISIISLSVSGFIAYHILYLSKKLRFVDRMSHIQEVRNKVEKILCQIANGSSRKVELINIKRYHSDYPKNNDWSRAGYAFLGAELKGAKFDGVEFFCDMPQSLYIDENGKYTLKQTDKHVEFNVYPVGLVPYEWIEYIDLRGDEYGYIPQFFIFFIGKGRYPYKKLEYYKRSEVYVEDRDPLGMEFVETVDVLSRSSSWVERLISGKLRMK